MNENMKEIDDLFGSWFAGFAAADGCFKISKQSQENPCARYRCQFQITLRDDDRLILEQIRDTLGMGTICDCPAYPHDSWITQATAVFRVSSTQECAELVKVFEKYPLRAKKQNDFEIWKQAVAELQKPVNCRDPLMLDYYFCKIREVRKYEEQEELARPRIKELQLTIKF